MYKLFQFILLNFILANVAHASVASPHINDLFNQPQISAANPFTLTILPEPNQKKPHKSVTATWKITPGAFLYRDKIAFKHSSSDEETLINAVIPEAEEIRQDPLFGEVKVFRDNLEIPITITNTNLAPIKLQVDYQGCSDQGICYPPVTENFRIDLKNSNQPIIQKVNDDNVTIDWQASNNSYETQEKTNAPATMTKNNDDYTSIIKKSNLAWTLLLFFGIGLLLAFTPCVLPMIPILSSIITGQKELTTTKAFKISLSYVLAMSFTYSIAGTIAGYSGNYLQLYLQQPWIIGSMAGLFIILALSMFGLYELRLPTKLQNSINHVSNKHGGGTYIAASIMGVLSTLIVSSCVTAPLIGVITYVTQFGDPVLGGLILFCMGLGMGTPLLIIGTSNGALLPRTGNWMNGIKSLSGVMLIAVAIYMLSKIIPPEMSLLLWASLLIILSIYLGALRFNHLNNWSKLSQGLGVLFLLYGSSLAIGVMSGNTDPLRPLSKNITNIETLNPTKINFHSVKTADELDEQLKLARLNNQYALVDFYADWCTECARMKKNDIRRPKCN